MRVYQKPTEVLNTPVRIFLIKFKFIQLICLHTLYWNFAKEILGSDFSFTSQGPQKNVMNVY